MIAAHSRMLDQEPGEIELLLPWYAAGTLNPRDARLVEEALARDPELAGQCAAIRQECARTIHLNESLGAPTARAMQKLFAAIDAEPVRKLPLSSRVSAQITKFLAGLSRPTLTLSTVLGALVVLLQAGVIGIVLIRDQGSSSPTVWLAADERGAVVTADLGPAGAPRALVRFAPDARMADISALLESYRASIVDGMSGGLFRLQFGDRVLNKTEAAALMSRLQKEKIVSLAVETP